MGNMNGFPTISATASPQKVKLLSPGHWYSFLNEGTNSVFIRSSEGVLASFAGSAADLRATSFHAIELDKDDCTSQKIDKGKVDVVCGTSETATLRIVSGIMSFKP